ncbi:FolC bifunctional protein [Vararia minispora EC-137]|uniref:FolC bifunctional protein n=1 Tax=Vararia minispora EC-137 TaxID=1314806 RepID=A0ACB8QFY3_9AGAM|nr:FolC bifunctional protein [Vararia minispora EC-137]
MATRTYQHAIECLNSLQSNAAHLEATRAAGNRKLNTAIPEMVAYLEKLGYKQEDLNRLNVIHVTGTKGKGSTCAFADSVLRHLRPSWKVGLYTSPHLVAARERIRINGAPISEGDFARFFFEVWDRLEANTELKFPTMTPKPMYFKFVTLVAYHAFLTLQVDATILEVGVGGRYDSTNAVPQPVVTGISALGIDHVQVLGKTIAEIAWQKAGIFKEGIPAITVNQPEDGMEVLKKEAELVKASEFVVASTVREVIEAKLGLAGRHQSQNAKLAVILVKKFLQRKEGIDFDSVPHDAIAQGLEYTKWPGRCQTVQDPRHPNITWFLDGAHTIESLECCMQWFVSPDAALRLTPSSERRTRVLVFNCTHGRSGPRFLACMLATAAEQLKLYASSEDTHSLFDLVVFCTNVTYADGHYKGDLTAVGIPEDELKHLTVQHELASAWKALAPDFPHDRVHVLPSIEHAVRLIQNVAGSGSNSTDILVTGSLLLVGGMIESANLSDVAL